MVDWTCWLFLVYISLISNIQSSPLTDVIRHYEPVNYDRANLLFQHHRSKRELIRFEIGAFGRRFKLRLSSNIDLFNRNIVITTSDGVYNYDMSRIYKGHLHDTENSFVHGIISNGGHFEGYISSPTDIFIVEPSDRYFNEEPEFHSVIYKMSDILINNKTYTDISELRELLKHKAQLKPQLHRKKQMDYSIHYFNQNNRNRRALDPTKNVCELYIKADHYFYQQHGSSANLVINQLVQYVQTVNDIFSAIDFNNDGSNIKFKIKKIKIYNNISDPAYSRYRGNFDVGKFLELHSQENYDDYCLAYVVTHRDFGGGVLGLAWTASLVESQIGGVCANYQKINGESLSLNTGLVTTLNYGETVSSIVSSLTLAHEIAHNMGSEHDPELNTTCTPGGTVGNYIMFPKATSGAKTNNQLFSVCSIQQMADVIATKGSSCFTAESESICGNKVIDVGEECDCGWEDECEEYCCNPRGSAATPCSLKVNATCSPSHGSCCSDDCELITAVSNFTCRQSTACQMESLCDSDNHQATCPVQQNIPDKTLCTGNRVCLNGECSGSICLAYDYLPCQCSPSVSGDWRDDGLCSVCCTVNDVCKNSYEIEGMSNMTMPPGSPCFDDEGYCDVFGKCREVDPSGFYSDLNKWLLASGETVVNWLTSYWWAAALISFGVVILLVLFVKIFSISPSEKRQARVDREPGHQPQDTQMQNRRHPSNNRVEPVTKVQVHHT